MRQKIGTALNEDILKRAKIRAAQESKDLNELLDDALRAYLSRHSATSGPQLVDKSWGVFRVTPKQLKEALKGEVFEP